MSNTQTKEMFCPECVILDQKDNNSKLGQIVYFYRGSLNRHRHNAHDYDIKTKKSPLIDN